LAVIAFDLAAQAAEALDGHGPTQETQDVAAAEDLDAVTRQAWVEAGQVGATAEQDVRGPLALLRHPVVRHAGLITQVGQQGVRLLRQAVQQGRPVGVPLHVEQLLGTRPVLDRHQQVVLAAVAEVLALEVAVQPVAAVEADAHGEGEPALQTDVAQAELLVQEVVVEVLAAGRFGLQVDVAALVLADAEGATAFDAAEDGDATGAQATLLRDGQGGGFLVGVGAVEVMDAVAVGRGQGFGAARQFLGELGGVAGVVLDEQVVLVEVAVHAAGVGQQAAETAEAETVEAAEDGEDQGAEAR